MSREVTSPGRASLARYDGAGINVATRTVPCIAVVDAPASGIRVNKEAAAFPLPGPPTLLRGMFVAIEIPVSSSLDLVQIPNMAMRPGDKVWLVRDGKLHVQAVQPAHVTHEAAILLADSSQLAEGDKVVISPIPIVEEGMDVRLVQEPTRTAAGEPPDSI